MKHRGSQLLEAHIRIFDPGGPTGRKRLAEALGEPLAQMLVGAMRPTPLPPRRDVLAA
jgi:hypothetical protein